MRHWINSFYNNLYFLLFILLFAYAQSIYMRIFASQEINIYTFTPEAAIFWFFKAGVLFSILLFFIGKWQKQDILIPKELLKIFGSSMLVYLLAMKVIALIIAAIYNPFVESDNIIRNFNQGTFFFTTFSDFLDGFIYGSFFLAYHYHNKSKNHQQQLAIYHQAMADSNTYKLKAQLNPHFLFNNLNVLDQLIEEDKHKASEFLNEFAEIYRYVLQASDKKLVFLNEEIAFAEQYFKLIQHKYGNAYQMNIKSKNDRGNIVPLTLQLLIENAVQHNLGTNEKPVYITIEAAECIRVSNNIKRKQNAKPTSGRALNNLQEQYRLLAENPVEIQQANNTFSVIIPIIQTSDK